jgi:hypothetical protein
MIFPATIASVMPVSGRDRCGRFPEFLEGLVHREDAAVETVGERHHGEFDDLVPRRIKSRRLDVKEQSAPRLQPIGRRNRRPGREPSKHAIPVAAVERGGHCVESLGVARQCTPFRWA